MNSSTQIKLTDLTRLGKNLRNAIDESIKKIINSGDFILGKELELFEREFASYIGSKYCAGVASGTDAMLLSLVALGITKNDEILVPAMTFIASVSPIMHLSAKPVLVDIFPDKPCIDPSKINSVITKKTKAIVPVDLHGYPCDMDAIKKIAEKYLLYIIEDACQAHGSIYKRKKAGSFGDVAVFSFYPGKNLGAFGDGGAILTSDKKLYNKILMLRDHGMAKKYIHNLLGFNSRLDTLQAAILRIKLKYLDKWNRKRRRLAQLYTTLLSGLPVILPREEENMYVNYHLYVIQTEMRDNLLQYLKQKGIQCGIHYPIPIHLQPALADLGYKEGSFLNAERFANTILSLPLFPELSVKEVEYICHNIRAFFQPVHTNLISKN